MQEPRGSVWDAIEGLKAQVDELQEAKERQERILQDIMSEQSDLDAVAQAEEADISALQSQVPTIQAGVNALESAIQTLQTQQPALDLSAIKAAQADLHTGLSALQGLSIPAPPAAPAPPVAPPAPAPTPAAPTAPTAAPTGTTGNVAVDASGKPLYEYTGTDPIDASVWIVSDQVASDGTTPLYTFANDTAGQPPTGASATWVPYTGTPQSKPAAGA